MAKSVCAFSHVNDTLEHDKLGSEVMGKMDSIQKKFKEKYTKHEEDVNELKRIVKEQHKSKEFDIKLNEDIKKVTLSFEKEQKERKSYYEKKQKEI